MILTAPLPVTRMPVQSSSAMSPRYGMHVCFMVTSIYIWPSWRLGVHLDAETNMTHCLVLSLCVMLTRCRDTVSTQWEGGTSLWSGRGWSTCFLHKIFELQILLWNNLAHQNTSQLPVLYVSGYVDQMAAHLSSRYQFKQKFRLHGN